MGLCWNCYRKYNIPAESLRSLYEYEEGNTVVE
jgi:hypothetical protein